MKEKLLTIPIYGHIKVFASVADGVTDDVLKDAILDAVELNIDPRIIPGKEKVGKVQIYYVELEGIDFYLSFMNQP